MSESVNQVNPQEPIKPKRVYKKKVVSIPASTSELEISTNPPNPHEPERTMPASTSELEISTNPLKKPRSQKQIDAFNLMREAKEKKKQDNIMPHIEPVSTKEPDPVSTQESEPVINGPKPKKTYKKKEPQQVYIDARTIHTPNPELYNEPPIYTQSTSQRIQEKNCKPYIFV